MKTVALGMIVKDEVDHVKRLVSNAIPYFDQIVLTVSDKTACNKLKKHFEKDPLVTVYWREWTDDFAAARNDNLSRITTDYMFWVDADDIFDFSKIPELMEYAYAGVDAVFLPYNYAQDDNGNCVTKHLRERLVNMSVGFEWRGMVHESLISDTPYVSHIEDKYEVKHLGFKPEESLERNLKILERAYDETKDPRYAMYLGMSYFTKKNYGEAIKILLDFIEESGNPNDQYRALCIISESFWGMKQPTNATEFALKAMHLDPSNPMAYWLLGQYDASQGNKAQAVEWLTVAESKPDPSGMMVWDPSSRDRSRLLMATTLFEMGEYNRALSWLRKVKDHTLVDDLYDAFVDEADKETFIDLLPRTRKFFASDEAIWKSLSDELKFDVRLKALRNNVTTPKKWDDKSIVIFCGQGYEEWGPHTLDKGMGGSEEAVVYLSRELAKLGWRVTVFAEANITDVRAEGHSVVWKPWQELDTRDEFNVFVSWRAPQFAEKVKAKVRIVDLHDVIPAEIVKDQDATYFVKSQYHRDLYKHLPDNKFKIIGNGIKKEQFK